MAERIPYFPIYIGDYLRQPQATCSMAAQGLFLRLKMIAHDSSRYGYLCEQGGAPISIERTAKLCGLTTDLCTSLLLELRQVGVPDVTTDGIYFFQDMVSQLRKRAGNRDRKRKERKRKDVTRLSRVTLFENENEYENESSVVVGDDGAGRRGKFPPTVEEVAVYAKEIGYALDAEKFVKYYGSVGWMRGKTKIKNWKLAVQTWKHNDKSTSNKLVSITESVRDVITAYRIAKDIPDDDKLWWTIHAGNCVEHAENLLKLCGGDLDHLTGYMGWFKDSMDKSRLSWTLKTMVDKYHDWRTANETNR